MAKALILISKFALLLVVLIFGYIIFVPTSYDNLPVFEPHADIKYWSLPTGSTIGYFHLPAVGLDEQTPIVYLHGGPGGMVYQEAIDLLKPLAEQGHSIYLYDQVGSGHSERLEDINEYTVERHREDLEAIIELIGAEKIILFAHSWGTLLATDFWGVHPQKIDKLIYSGPGPMLPINRKLRQLPPPDSLGLMPPKYSNRAANEETYTLRNKLIDHWAEKLGRKMATDEEVDQFFTILNGRLSQSTTCFGDSKVQYQAGLGYYSHLMTVKSFREVTDKRAVIAKSNVPLLILKGQCDNQAWGYTQEYLNLFPTASLHIIKGAGHSVDMSNKDEYLAVIKSFLSNSQNEKGE